MSVYEVFSRLDEVDFTVLAHLNKAFRRHFARQVSYDRTPMEAYARRGYVAVMRWDQEGPKPSTLTPSVFVEACRSRNVEAVKFLYERNCPRDLSAVKEAASLGCHKIIDYLMSVGVEMPREIFEIASKNKRIKVMETLIDSPSTRDIDCLPLVASIGSRALIERVVAQRKLDYYDVMQTPELAQSGKVDLLEWIIQQEGFSSEWSKAAAEAGHVHVLEYLQEKGYLKKYENYTPLAAAIEHGQLEVVKWFQEREEDILQWLTYQWDRAAGNGNIELMKLGVKAGVNLTWNMFNNAVKKGNVPMVEWLDRNNCPRAGSESYFRDAIKKGHIQLAHYFAKTVTDIEEAKHSFNLAIAHGDIELLRCFIAWGVKPAESHLGVAAAAGRLDVFKFFHQECNVPLQGHAVIAIMKAKTYHDTIFMYLKRVNLKIASDWLWEILVDADSDENAIPTKFQLNLISQLGLKIVPSYAITAAENTRFDLLTWLYDRNCPIDYAALKKLKLISPYTETIHYRALYQWIRDHPQRVSFPPSLPVVATTPNKSKLSACGSLGALGLLFSAHVGGIFIMFLFVLAMYRLVMGSLW